MSKVKRILPLLILTIFTLLIFFFYQKNQDDFSIIKKIDLEIIFQIIILCFLYLLTEGFVLKNIVLLLGSKISLFKSFLVMNATYFCNTFIQFSGLGYRVYYLKKFKKLKVIEILRFTLDTIACELIIFSLVGIFSLLYIDIFSSNIDIGYLLYISFSLFFLGSLIYLILVLYCCQKIKIFLNNLNFFLFDKIINFFLIKKKNFSSFLKKQFCVFFIQYIILFLIFILVLKKIDVNNYLEQSLLVTSLVDFSFLIAFTPYSVGISEFITFIGTRNTPITFAEILILINIFRACMAAIYLVIGPIFISFNFKK